jgi:hypothetical protein
MKRNKAYFKEITADRYLGPGTNPTTGNTYYVGSVTGSNVKYAGLTPDTAWGTLAYGLSQIADGDTIYVLPGHTENLTVATSINIAATMDNVSIIGIGEGNMMPKFSTTAAAGSITLAGTNCLIENIWVYSNFATGTTTGITVAATADGSTLRKIRMTEAANTSEFLTWISVATTIADFTIEGCYLQGIIGGTDANAIIFAGTSANCKIVNNYIYGDFSGDVIDHNTGASTTILISGNRIANMDTGADGDCISLKSDGTGYIVDNYGFYNKNAATVFTGAAAVWHQNYGSNTLGDSGILFPAAAAAIP